MNIREILKSLSPEEKSMLLTGYGSMDTMPIERFDIESKKLADGPHGIRFDASEGKNSTYFPNLCALSSSWNRETAYRMGKALGIECKYHKKSMLLGPGINIKRNILCGRNFEYLSEDPILTGELAASYINGLQDEGISACVKHFAVNNQETNRSSISVEVDERTLREIYLKAFQIAIKKGRPDAVMCAYNKLYAIWCSENSFLLKQVLRKEWGFEGLVVSDWGAVHDADKAIKAGMNLIMPHRKSIVTEVKNGLEEGTLKREELDEAVRHVLEWVSGKKNMQSSEYRRRFQHEEAVQIAKDSIVLLKNENRTLPLTQSKYKKIAVIGEYALHPLIGGQGSAEVYPEQEYVDSPLECLRAVLPDIEFKYMELYQKAVMPSTMLWPELNSFHCFVEDCEAIIFFVGEMESESTENFDRRSAQINPNIDFFINAACEYNKKIIVVLQSGGALILGKWRERVDSVIQMWLAGEGAGTAIADILSGKANPSGKLAETFPVKQRETIDFGNETEVSYLERMEIGYRFYDRHPDEIAFPFGHGLSYTEFQYMDGRVEIEGDNIAVYLSVLNQGETAGAEVVQIYVGQMAPAISRPVKELKAFEKIYLEAWQKKKIKILVPIDELGYYNPFLHDWVVENDIYLVFVGSSSRDIRLKMNIQIEKEMPYSTLQKGEVLLG